MENLSFITDLSAVRVTYKPRAYTLAEKITNM